MTDDDVPFLIQKYGIEATTIGSDRKWTVSVEKNRTRRQWALTMQHPDEPTCHQVVAYFPTEEKADKFVEFLRVLVPDK